MEVRRGATERKDEKRTVPKIINVVIGGPSQSVAADCRPLGRLGASSEANVLSHLAEFPGLSENQSD